MFHTLSDSYTTVIVIVIARTVQVIAEIGTEYIVQYWRFHNHYCSWNHKHNCSTRPEQTRFTYQLYSQCIRATRPNLWCLNMCQVDRTATLGP